MIRTSEKRLQLVFYQTVVNHLWVVSCPELNIWFTAGTQKQALVAMANALKRIKKDHLEKALGR
jgi:hypothetical protein